MERGGREAPIDPQLIKVGCASMLSSGEAPGEVLHIAVASTTGCVYHGRSIYRKLCNIWTSEHPTIAKHLQRCFLPSLKLKR